MFEQQTPYTQVTQRHQQQQTQGQQGQQSGGPISSPSRPSGWSGSGQSQSQQFGSVGQGFNQAISQIQNRLANATGADLECLRDAGVPEQVAHELVTVAYSQQ